MVAPIVLITLAGGGLIGANKAVNGLSTLNLANVTQKELLEKHRLNIEYYERRKKKIDEHLDKIGKKELEILNTFERFSDVIEKIQNRPQFENYSGKNISIPKYDREKLKEISIGAGLALGGLAGATLGTAGGFAAAGATTSIATAIGSASTGATISSLKGAAATKALMAYLGGGAIKAGGLGVAGGTVLLSGATIGVGILVGGFIFEKIAENTMKKVEEIASELNRTGLKIREICGQFDKLLEISTSFYGTLVLTNRIYKENLEKLITIVEKNGKTDWSLFTPEEELITQNTILLVGLVWRLINTKLLLEGKNKNDGGKINEAGIVQKINETKKELVETGLKK